jgi:hypothetical protein
MVVVEQEGQAVLYRAKFATSDDIIHLLAFSCFSLPNNPLAEVLPTQ